MPRPERLGDVNDPPISDPDDPPRANLPPRGHTTRPITIAEQGKALPIVYGQAKVVAQLIEKSAAQTTNRPTRRTASATVYAGEYRTVLAYLVQGVGAGNDGTFLCTTTGVTSAAGDFTAGSLITAGQTGIGDGSVVWTCISLGDCEAVSTQQFTAALCEGEITGAINLYWDKEVIAAPSLTSPGKACGLAVGPDAATQNLSGFSAENYQHTAVLFAAAAPTGTQKEIPALAVELKGIMFGGAGPDVSPADILNDLLTHTRRGAGWVSSRVDSSITGSGVSGYRVYCDAYGLRLSMVLDSQQTAAAIIAALLAATNCEAVWSQGALRCVPLGDTSSSSPVFGATNYVAPSVAVASFGPADFLDPTNPVQIQRRDDNDCFNSWPIEFTDRLSRYARATVEDQVLDDVEVRGGVARAGVTSYPIILPNGTQATMLSRILGNRSIKNRNTYTFRVSWASGVLVEPCDLLTVTEPGIGLVNAPMRATSVSEAEDNTFSITTEDWPVGVQAALAYTPQANDGLRTNDRASLASISGGATGARPVGAPATVGAAQIGPGQIGVAATSITNLDNLWPNATSEGIPPVNADTTIPTWSNGSVLISGSAEWYGRVNAGAGAYAGSWVRQITAGVSGSYTSSEHRIPCAPGESFYFEVFAKYLSGTLGTGNAYGILRWRDAVGNVLLSVGTNTTTSGSWTLLAASQTAPAGAVSVGVLIEVSAGSGSGQVFQFDAFYVRRMVDLRIVSADVLKTSNYAESSIAAWAATTSYSQGDIRSYNGNSFVCDIGGISGTNPAVLGTASLDGSCFWILLFAGTSYPTQGAKMDSAGVALKASGAGALVGKRLITDSIAGSFVMAQVGVDITLSAGADPTYAFEVAGTWAMKVNTIQYIGVSGASMVTRFNFRGCPAGTIFWCLVGAVPLANGAGTGFGYDWRPLLENFSNNSCDIRHVSGAGAAINPKGSGAQVVKHVYTFVGICPGNFFL